MPAWLWVKGGRWVLPVGQDSWDDDGGFSGMLMLVFQC